VRTYSDSLGKALDVWQKATAKLVLAHKGISDIQFKKRILDKKIPGWVIQDQNQNLNQHARIRH